MKIFTRIIFLKLNEGRNENRRHYPDSFSTCRNDEHQSATCSEVSITKDKYKDIIVCAISSVVPAKLSANEILITPQNTNKLRVPSVLKVDRIVTLKRKDVIHQMGKLNHLELEKFKEVFRKLVA